MPQGGADALNLQQATATIIEHRKVNDLLRMWEERISKQAMHFETFASQVLQFDTEIIANASKVKALRMEHAYLKARQDAVNESIQQVLEQQDSLGKLLSGLEVALNARLPPNAQEPSRTHQRAHVLAVQLDEVDRQVEDLARETRTVQSALYVEPLVTVVRVLDAHASALDSIQGQVNGVTQRLREVETTL